MDRVMSAAVCAAVFALAGCRSSTEPVDPDLSRTAAVRAASVYFGYTYRVDLLQPLIDDPNDPNSVRCPRGGSVSSGAPEGGTGFRRQVRYLNCAIADSAGRVWTFTSLPTLRTDGSLVSTDSTVGEINTATGALRVESDGVRGTCRIDVRFRRERRRTAPGRFWNVQSGRICGQSIDTTYSFVVPSN